MCRCAPILAPAHRNEPPYVAMFHPCFCGCTSSQWTSHLGTVRSETSIAPQVPDQVRSVRSQLLVKTVTFASGPAATQVLGIQENPPFFRDATSTNAIPSGA